MSRLVSSISALVALGRDLVPSLRGAVSAAGGVIPTIISLVLRRRAVVALLGHTIPGVDAVIVVTGVDIALLTLDVSAVSRPVPMVGDVVSRVRRGVSLHSTGAGVSVRVRPWSRGH